MNKLMIATILTASTAVAQPALADYDTVGAAVFGSVAGAVIGHAVGGRQGAAVGAALGGLSGLSVNSSRSYYEREPVVYRQSTYYEAPAQVAYYPQYYQPVRQVAYPVSQVVYYGNSYREYQRYDHHHNWDDDDDCDHEHDWHRGYSNY